MPIELATLVADFAVGMCVADAARPIASRRMKKGQTPAFFKPGIGPHAEDKAVDLTVAQMCAANPARYSTLDTKVDYPNSAQECDLAVERGREWAIEVKMARFSGDNGKPDPNAVKDLLSPFPIDRSALTDCDKLVASGLTGNKAVLIYGFEDDARALDLAISAFEALASHRVGLGPRVSAQMSSLTHPVFKCGRVFAWEISRRN